MKTLFPTSVFVACILALSAQGGLPPIDGLLPDSGGSGVPTVTIPKVEPGSALSAMLVIGDKYAGGILSVTGRGGAPVPGQWVILARNADFNGKLHQLTVAGDQIVADRISLNPFQAGRSYDSHISIASMQVDSGRAFSIAQKFSAARGLSLGSIDYSIKIQGKGVSPVWVLKCMDPNGRSIGKLEILTKSGEMISNSGFKAPPTR